MRHQTLNGTNQSTYYKSINENKHAHLPSFTHSPPATLKPNPIVGITYISAHRITRFTRVARFETRPSSKRPQARHSTQTSPNEYKRNPNSNPINLSKAQVAKPPNTRTTISERARNITRWYQQKANKHCNIEKSSIGTSFLTTIPNTAQLSPPTSVGRDSQKLLSHYQGHIQPQLVKTQHAHHNMHFPWHN